MSEKRKTEAGAETSAEAAEAQVPGAPADDPIADVAEAGPDDTEAAPGDAGDAAEPAAAGDAARIAALEADVARLEQEKQDIYDRLLRQAADLENFRKRSKRDVDDARSAAKIGVLKEMLPVVDNLELAVKHAQTTPGDGGAGDAGVSGIIDGVKLVLRQFSQAFERCDVTPIEAEGKPFDPNVHEAISQLETAEHPPGSVVQAYQRGYKIGDRLLRPALVVVAKAPPEASAGNGHDTAGGGNGAGARLDEAGDGPADEDEPGGAGEA